MLLGVAGLVPGDWKSIDGAVLDNVAQHGFKTVPVSYTHLTLPTTPYV